MTEPRVPNVLLRPMIARDLARAEELTHDLGWPHRKEDWELLLKLGEGIVAEVDGRVEGTIMACRHGSTLATVGMVIVDKKLQGKGLGRRLLNAVIAQLKDYTIILQATETGVPLYVKLGFTEAGTLYQHQGLAPPVPHEELAPNESLKPIDSDDAVPAMLYSRASHADRHELVKALLANDRGALLTRDGVGVGFAMLRHFGRGLSIAPVVAPDVRAAKALILYWLGQVTGKFVRVDVNDHGDLSAWLTNIGLPQADGARTMVHGPSPKAAVDDVAVFALTAQALG